MAKMFLQTSLLALLSCFIFANAVPIAQTTGQPLLVFPAEVIFYGKGLSKTDSSGAAVAHFDGLPVDSRSTIYDMCTLALS